ncbi:hypothetical protein AU377_08220 [Sporosarcina sp. HYO08]|nr:hypothetical protein AU377_08220 [Sporosarcina sp. HYO08]
MVRSYYGNRCDAFLWYSNAWHSVEHIAVGFESTLGLNKTIIGIVMVALLGIIIFGGVERIAGVADKVVPFILCQHNEGN